MKNKWVCGVVCVVALLFPAVVSADLIAHYMFDNNLLDSSGNVHDATLVGSADYVDFGNDRFGMSNSALWFAGTGGTNSEYIDTGITEYANDTGSLTVTAWLWADSTKLATTLIASKTGGGGNRDWNLSLEPQGGVEHTVRFRVSGTGSDLPGGYTTTSLPLNQWVHVAAVYQAGPGAHMKIYFNGIEQGFTLAAEIPQSRFNGSETIRIGHRPGLTPRQWWKGAIDDFRVYNTALSQAEIEAIIPEVKTNMAWLPIPGDGAFGTLLTDLSWRVPLFDNTPDPDDPNKLSWTYQVYFDTLPSFSNVITPIDAGQGLVATNAASVSNASIAPLTVATTYYWRVDAIEPNALHGDNIYTGDVWMFEVGAESPTLVGPDDTYTEAVNIDVILDWISDPIVSFSKVIITPEGHDPIDLGARVPPFQPIYDIGITMEWNQQYQWQIVELDADGTTILAEGPLWKFRVRELQCIGMFADIDGSGDCVVNIADLAVLLNEWLQCGWDDGGKASPCP